jgi:dolichol-phosphate mannosyltransferase
MLESVSWEVIFVDDDSPDGTAERIREIGRRDR